MRVRILRRPVGSINGLDLSLYKPRHVYELPANLASYLVAIGVARFEMRISENPQPPEGVERRRHIYPG